MVSLWVAFVLAFVAALSLFGQNLQNNESIPTIDSSFDFGSTNTTIVRDISILGDGKIAFAGVGGSTFGILDSTGVPLTMDFAASRIPLYSIAENEEHVFITGGSYPSAGALQRIPWNNLDATFLMNSQVAGDVRKVLISASTGDIIAVGRCLFGTNSYGLVSVKRTGQLDAGFHLEGSAGCNLITGATDHQGRILASGLRTTSGTTEIIFARWMPNGTLDVSFDGSWVRQISPDAQITLIEMEAGAQGFLAAVQFTQGDVVTTKLLRLSVEGEPEPGEITNVTGSLLALAFEPITPATSQSGGYDRIIIGGSFTSVSGIACTNLAAIFKDGTVSWSIPTTRGPNGPVNALAIQSDGAILAGGAFNQFDGAPARPLVRLKGASASGANYVYWEDTEFRAFERLGVARITLARSGDTNAELALGISVEAQGNSALSRLGEVPASVVFREGEFRKSIDLSLPKDSLANGRATYTLKIYADATNRVLLTRASTKLVILDDETPGTLDPLFRSPVPFFVSTIHPEPNGNMLLGYSLPPVGVAGVMRIKRDGSVDPAFATNGVPAKTSTFSQVAQIAPAPDGKFYVSGTFAASSPYGINLIARLNANGTLDTNFNPGLVPPLTVTGNPAIFAVQPDGKVIVAQQYSGTLRYQQSIPKSLLRLKPDGTRDSSFDVIQEFNVVDIELLKDGKMLVAGGVHTQGDVLRLTTNGVTDSAFKVHTDGVVYDIALMGDSLVVAGDFSTVNGIQRSGIAFVNLTNAIVDTNLVLEADGGVRKLLLREDGKIYLAGNFTRINGSDRYRIARLNADRTLDFSYDPGLGFALPPVIALHADGTLLASAQPFLPNFSYVDRVSSESLVRLNESLTGQLRFVTNTFQAREFGGVATIEVERIGGQAGPISTVLHPIDGSAHGGQDYSTGDLTITFADMERGRKQVEIPIFGNESSLEDKLFSVQADFGNPPAVATIVIKETGPAGQIRFVSEKISVGEFEGQATIEVERAEGDAGPLLANLRVVDGSAHAGADYAETNVVISFADGESGRKAVHIPIFGKPEFTGDKVFLVALESANLTNWATVLVKDAQLGLFESTFGIQLATTNQLIRDFAVLGDGSVVVGGNFTNLHGTSVTNLARLNPDFSLDPDFVPRDLPTSRISALSLSRDGRLILGLDGVPNTNYSGVMLLNPDFTFDSNFTRSNRLAPGGGRPKIISCLQDGSIYCLDDSSSLSRLLPTGGRDTSFLKITATSFLPMPDSSVLYGNSSSLLRADSSGRRDTNFSMLFSAGASPKAIVLDAQGRILLGGAFTSQGSNPAAQLARLLPDFTFDQSFHTDAKTNDDFRTTPTVTAILPLPNGDIVIGGNFSRIGGQSRALLALLNSDGELRPEFDARLTGKSVDKIALLPDGTIMVRGDVTQVDSNKVSGAFKLRLKPTVTFAPVVKILSPTNGTVINTSEAMSPTSISVQAYDPDGFLREVQLQIDGIPVATNQNGSFTHTESISAPGIHEITVIAEDEGGLVSSNRVSITVQQSNPLPEPIRISFTTGGEGMTLLYPAVQKLQISFDLKNWSDLPVEGAANGSYMEYNIGIETADAHRFYRSVAP